MTTQDIEIAELVEKAKTGNMPALEKLVSTFHEGIFRLVWYRTRSRMDAEDLTQEIFMQMHAKIRKVNDPKRFRPWLYRIAVNRVKDFHRKKKILVFIGAGSDVDDFSAAETDRAGNPSDDLARKEFFIQFRKLADSLPFWEREVFMLRFMDNLGIREIAETLKKNESTVKTHLYRALKKFRQQPEMPDLLKGGAR